MSSDVLSLLPSTAAATTLAPSTAEATALAPGFRFHPTDDELVSYYLRRKIVGRPLRVDAISEVDLYKVEPWDLPSMSRIQSRDTEWYFFSPLDKKYATRTRTSRTTGQGYWKTTGKDRAVKHGSRAAGMKKTLVFHVGKAPHGDRTNWVMHEYRLTDEDLAKAGVPQDSYVVCRIFQKSGSGPQNGAQYGASFVEEEWEDENKWLVPEGEDTKGHHIKFGHQQYMQVEKSDEEGIRIGNEKETAPSDTENVCNYVSDDYMQSHVDVQAHDDEYFINGSDQLSEAQNEQDIYHANMEENNILSKTMTAQVHGDDYLELNDFACPLAADHLPTQDPVIYDDVHLGNNGNSFQLDNFDSRDTGSSTKKLSGCSLVPMNADNLLNVEMNELFNPTVDGYFPSGNAVIMEYYDAPSQIPVVVPGAFFTGMDEPDAPDLVDELLAFFDATEDDLVCSYLENPVTADSPKPSPAQFTFEANQDSASGFQTSCLIANPNINEGLLSPTEVPPSDELPAISPLQSPPAHNLSCTKPNNGSTSDVRFGSGWHKSFTNHCVNMLDSISSPPAFAEPPPFRHAKSLNLNQSSSSIRFTAGVVQLNTFSAGLNRKAFSVQQKGDPSVLLSYATTQNDILDAPEAFDSVRKLNCGPGCWLIGSGFCLSFISVLFLAASFGVYICSR